MSEYYRKNLTESQIITTQKHAGETLAVFLGRVRGEYGVPAGEKMTYAGRLDPMAEGEMIVLTGEYCKQKDDYLGFDKTYIVDVLLGISTDTGDMLGIVSNMNIGVHTEQEIQDAVSEIEKIKKLAYPEYSSKTVDGIPLWVSARAGDAVVVPEKEVVLSDVSLLSITYKKLRTLLDESYQTIQNVQGDFRQHAILSAWQKIYDTYGDREVLIVRIHLTASTGAYMRTLAQTIGEILHTPALAYHIHRTKICVK